MPFPPKVKEEALFRSRRHCCICHKFAGLFTNVHHIQPEADGGASDLENAVVLCLECHGQAGHYNSKHPIGDKYKPSEIIRHRDAWWEWCKSNPFAPFPDDPVAISPSTVAVPGGEAECQEVLTIHNRSDFACFDVWLKVPVGCIGLKPADLSFRNNTNPVHRLAAVGHATVVGDVLSLHGLDGDRVSTIWVCLKSIAPRATYALTLQFGKRNQPLMQRLPVYLIGWSNEPNNSFQHRDGVHVAIPFAAPEEGMTIEGMGFLFGPNNVAK